MRMSGWHTVGMAATGTALAVLVPGLLLATRGSALWRRLAVPWPVALPLFVTVHAAVVLAHGTRVRLPVEPWAGMLVVACAAVWFWLPVLGPRHRLTDTGRCLYLFLAGPLLDLPAVVTIALGDTADGLTMIVSMLPVGLAAVLVTWRWVASEERSARLAELDDGRPSATWPPRTGPASGERVDPVVRAGRIAPRPDAPGTRRAGITGARRGRTP